LPSLDSVDLPYQSLVPLTVTFLGDIRPAFLNNLGAQRGRGSGQCFRQGAASFVGSLLLDPIGVDEGVEDRLF